VASYIVIRTRAEDPQVYIVQGVDLTVLKTKVLLDAEAGPFKEFVHALSPATSPLALSMSNNCFGGTMLKREYKTDPASRAQQHVYGLLSAAWQGGKKSAITTLEEAARQIDEEIHRLKHPKELT